MIRVMRNNNMITGNYNENDNEQGSNNDDDSSDI